VALFGKVCAACHKKDGTGITGLAPPLAKVEWAAGGKPDARRYMPLVVLNGMAGKIVAGGKTFVSAMPPQKQHSDDEIAMLATYVMATLNTPPAGWKDYTADEIATLRAEKIDHQGLLALRARLLE
jgi:mono/diheme cytochrome c family protein